MKRCKKETAAQQQTLPAEAQEFFGASTPEEARRVLVERGRACLAQGYQDGLTYLVLDFELQKRSRYYAFEDWADTPAGRWHLHKRDRRTRQWIPMPRRSEAGRFVVPRDARGVFKTHCDHTFGGQEWFDVLNQMGGCPTEFVDAWNAVIDQRLQVAV